eukprot:tig00020909_g15328.t1
MLQVYVRPSDSILMVGCGNSKMSEDMYEDGYKDITNVDISPIVIDAMRRANAERSMHWHTMDIRQLPADWAGKFDVVIDKGTMDALLCGEGSTANVLAMCQNISRVLKPGGVFVMISYGAPDHRLCYLENREFGWGIKVHTIAKNLPKYTTIDADDEESSNVHYIYACTKFGVKPAAVEPTAAAG